MTQPFGYHSQNSPSKPQAALSIRHEQVHFNPVFFSFNFVSKAFPCKNVISQFVSYLNRTEALKPELIFTSPEIGNTKQLDNWSSPVTPQERNLEMLGFGFISHTDAGQIEGSWCPVSAERSCPCQVKLLPLQQEASATHEVLWWNPSSAYTC